MQRPTPLLKSLLKMVQPAASALPVPVPFVCLTGPARLFQPGSLVLLFGCCCAGP